MFRKFFKVSATLVKRYIDKHGVAKSIENVLRTLFIGAGVMFTFGARIKFWLLNRKFNKSLSRRGISNNSYDYDDNGWEEAYENSVLATRRRAEELYHMGGSKLVPTKKGQRLLDIYNNAEKAFTAENKECVALIKKYQPDLLKNCIDEYDEMYFIYEHKFTIDMLRKRYGLDTESEEKSAETKPNSESLNEIAKECQEHWNEPEENKIGTKSKNPVRRLPYKGSFCKIENFRTMEKAYGCQCFDNSGNESKERCKNRELFKDAVTSVNLYLNWAYCYKPDMWNTWKATKGIEVWWLALMAHCKNTPGFLNSLKKFLKGKEYQIKGIMSGNPLNDMPSTSSIADDKFLARLESVVNRLNQVEVKMNLNTPIEAKPVISNATVKSVLAVPEKKCIVDPKVADDPDDYSDFDDDNDYDDVTISQDSEDILDQLDALRYGGNTHTECIHEKSNSNADTGMYYSEDDSILDQLDALRSGANESTNPLPVNTTHGASEDTLIAKPMKVKTRREPNCITQKASMQRDDIDADTYVQHPSQFLLDGDVGDECNRFVPVVIGYDENSVFNNEDLVYSAGPNEYTIEGRAKFVIDQYKSQYATNSELAKDLIDNILEDDSCADYKYYEASNIMKEVRKADAKANKPVEFIKSDYDSHDEMMAASLARVENIEHYGKDVWLKKIANRTDELRYQFEIDTVKAILDLLPDYDLEHKAKLDFIDELIDYDDEYLMYVKDSKSKVLYDELNLHVNRED